VVVGDDKIDAVQAAVAQGLQKVLPARSALQVDEFGRKHLAPGSRSPPTAISTVWLASARTRS